MTDGAAILARCRLFGRLSRPAQAALAAIAEVRDVAAGSVLFRQGDECPGAYVVGHGMVRVYKLSPNGKEHVLHLAGPGATFAEAAAIAGFPAPAFAEAVEFSRVALLPGAKFRDFLKQDHQACIDLLVGLSSWLHHVVDLLEDVVLRDAAGRLARHLLAHAGPDGVVRLPGLRKHLASQLNLTPETASRTLRRFADDGCVTVDREEIAVTDTARLQAIAEGMFPAV